MPGPGSTTGTVAPERIVAIMTIHGAGIAILNECNNGPLRMPISPRFTICTIDGDLQVDRITWDSWCVHFPGGERDDVLVCDQAVSVLTDPYILAAVEAVIEFETRKLTEAGLSSRACED